MYRMGLIRSPGLRIVGSRAGYRCPGRKGRRGLLPVHSMPLVSCGSLTLRALLLPRGGRVPQVASLLSRLFTGLGGLARQKALLLPGQFLRCQHTFGREDDLGMAEVGLEA